MSSNDARWNRLVAHLEHGDREELTAFRDCLRDLQQANGAPAGSPERAAFLDRWGAYCGFTPTEIATLKAPNCNAAPHSVTSCLSAEALLDLLAAYKGGVLRPTIEDDGAIRCSLVTRVTRETDSSPWQVFSPRVALSPAQRQPARIAVLLEACWRADGWECSFQEMPQTERAHDEQVLRSPSL